MLHGSQKYSAHTKAQRFEWTNKNIPQTQKHKGLNVLTKQYFLEIWF